jgi:probable HAF family extracellular repeat protein
VGSYDDDTGTHGFFRDTDGTFTTLDFPGATGTGAGGINNDGDIVGGYTDATGNHAFLATPCESAHVRGKRLRRHRRTQ